MFNTPNDFACVMQIFKFKLMCNLCKTFPITVQHEKMLTSKRVAGYKIELEETVIVMLCSEAYKEQIRDNLDQTVNKHH